MYTDRLKVCKSQYIIIVYLCILSLYISVYYHCLFLYILGGDYRRCLYGSWRIAREKSSTCRMCC